MGDFAGVEAEPEPENTRARGALETRGMVRRQGTQAGGLEDEMVSGKIEIQSHAVLQWKYGIALGDAL
jgi:hypothetical protein